jgi:hypothetical protein
MHHPVCGFKEHKALQASNFKHHVCLGGVGQRRMGLKPSILVWFSLLMEGKMVKGKAAEKITIFKEDNETRKGLQSRGQLAYLPQDFIHQTIFFSPICSF